MRGTFSTLRAYLARQLRRLADRLAPAPVLAIPEPRSRVRVTRVPAPPTAVDLVDGAVLSLLEAGRISAAAELRTRASGYRACGCRRCTVAAEVLHRAAGHIHRSAVPSISSTTVGSA